MDGTAPLPETDISINTADMRPADAAVIIRSQVQARRSESPADGGRAAERFAVHGLTDRCCVDDRIATRLTDSHPARRPHPSVSSPVKALHPLEGGVSHA